MATVNESIGKGGTQPMQESWIEVEEGISHVRSHEEVQELLADAATMDTVHATAEQSREIKHDDDDSDDGQPLSFVCKEDTASVNTTIESEQNDGFLSSLIQTLRNVLSQLFHPITTHLAMFGIGLFIGHRLAA